MHSYLPFVADAVVVQNGDDGVFMSLIIWLVIGVVAGFLASKVVNKRGDGLVLDLVLGLVGSVVGGFIVRMLGIWQGGGMIASIVVATLGAILVLVVYHKVIGRTATV